MTYDARTQGFESYDATGFVANQLGLNYWTDTAAQGGFYKRTEYTAGGTSSLAADCGAMAYALDSGIAGGGTPAGDADVRSRDFLGGDVQTRPSLALANQLLCAHQNGNDLAGIAAIIKMRGYQGSVAPDDAALATPEPLGFGFSFWKDTSTTPAVVKIKDAAGGWAPVAMHVNTAKAGLWNGCDFIALWDTDADAAINPGSTCTWLPDGAGGYQWTAAAVAADGPCIEIPDQAGGNQVVIPIPDVGPRAISIDIETEFAALFQIAFEDGLGNIVNMPTAPGVTLRSTWKFTAGTFINRHTQNLSIDIVNYQDISFTVRGTYVDSGDNRATVTGSAGVVTIPVSEIQNGEYPLKNLILTTDPSQPICGGVVCFGVR